MCLSEIGNHYNLVSSCWSCEHYITKARVLSEANCLKVISTVRTYILYTTCNIREKEMAICANHVGIHCPLPFGT